MTITTHVLDRAYPLSWALMPIALERIRAFCEKYRTNLTADVLCPNVIRHFSVEADPKIKVILGLRDLQVIGHLVVTIDEFSGSLFAWIVQYELDQGIPLQLQRETFDQIRWWAKARGAKSVEILAPLDDRAVARLRLYRRLGFRAQYVKLNMPIEGGEAHQPNVAGANRNGADSTGAPVVMQAAGAPNERGEG